jgi:hypothetical protein
VSGATCQGWQAMRWGPHPGEPPQLSICIEPVSTLPVRMTVQETTYKFSNWNEPLTIEAPSLEPQAGPTPLVSADTAR